MVQQVSEGFFKEIMFEDEGEAKQRGDTKGIVQMRAL